jgi:membrane protease YdiL (CAAX protease family)
MDTRIHLSSFIKHYALAIFCGLTFLLTFTVTFLPVPDELVPVVIVFIPAFMAIGLTALSEGKTGVRSLLAKLAQWRINLKWVLIALALALVIRLTMSIIALGLGIISTIQFRPGGPTSYILLGLIFFVFAVPEELGWRGYALQKLLKQRTPLESSLIVGVLWGSLHLALLLPGMMNEGAAPLPTLLGLVGGSVLFTWLFVNSDGNILLTMLFHAAQSFFVIVNEGIGLNEQAWLMAGVYVVAALLLVMVVGPNLERRPILGISQGLEPTRSDSPLARK